MNRQILALINIIGDDSASDRWRVFPSVPIGGDVLLSTDIYTIVGLRVSTNLFTCATLSSSQLDVSRDELIAAYRNHRHRQMNDFYVGTYVHKCVSKEAT